MRRKRQARTKKKAHYNEAVFTINDSMFHETVEVLLENEAATAEDVRISFEMDRREICCNATKLC